MLHLYSSRDINPRINIRINIMDTQTKKILNVCLQPEISDIIINVAFDDNAEEIFIVDILKCVKSYH